MAKLTGKNQIRRFRKAAEQLTTRISQLDGVAGIVFIGGLVRGFVDKFSDIDVIVFLSKMANGLKRKVRDIGLDEGNRSGLDIDLEIHLLSDFAMRKWDEMSMWEFSRAEIVFDPKGDVSRLFEKKLKISESFWIKRIAVYAEYLKWYCCPPKEEVGTIAEAWIKRGNLASAHYCLNYSVDLVLKLMFALNKEFLPAPKWRVFYSYNLKWLPSNYKAFLEEATIPKSPSMRGLRRRIRAIRLMWLEITPKIEKVTGLTLEQLSKYYVEKMLHQT